MCPGQLEARYNAIKKGMEDYISSKAAECERLSAEVENNECDMKKKETKADDCLQVICCYFIFSSQVRVIMCWS
jgi:hypothetical protein